MLPFFKVSLCLILCTWTTTTCAFATTTRGWNADNGDFGIHGGTILKRRNVIHCQTASGALQNFHQRQIPNIPFPSLPQIDVVDISPAQIVTEAILGTKKPLSKTSIHFSLILNFFMATPILSIALKVWLGLFWKPYMSILNQHGLSAALMFGALCNLLVMNAFMAISSIPSVLFTDSKRRQSRLKQMLRDLPLWSMNNIFGLVLQHIVMKLATPKRALISTIQPSTNLLVTGLQFSAIALVTEVLFFSFHKLQHVKGKTNFIIKYLRKIHRVHHTAGHGSDSELIPMSGGLMHPVEFLCVVGISAIVGPTLLGSSPALHFAWYMMAYITSCVQHSGYAFADLGIHHLHHERPNKSFGAIGLMDTLFGTLATKRQ